MLLRDSVVEISDIHCFSLSLKLGAYEFITKPFATEQLLNFINFDRANHTAEQAYSLAFVQGPMTTILMIVPIIILHNVYSLSLIHI